MEKNVSRERLVDILSKVEAELSRPVDIYLIGGSAMEILHMKASTKDIDMVVDSGDEPELASALSRAGLSVNIRRRGATVYDADEGGIPVDLFAGQICGRMTLTDGIKRRSFPVDIRGKARIHAISKEDIFLLKSITERARDSDEMLALMRSGINHRTILEECDAQDGDTVRQDRPIYEAFLATKLSDMEERHGIQVPWKREVIRIAENKMLDHAIFRFIASKVEASRSDISKNFPGMGRKLGERLRWLVSNRYISLTPDGLYELP